MVSKPVHGWLKISTLCQLEWLIRFGEFDLQRMAVSSIRVVGLKIGQNSTS